jgi:hypothetical protein
MILSKVNLACNTMKGYKAAYEFKCFWLYYVLKSFFFILFLAKKRIHTSEAVGVGVD